MTDLELLELLEKAKTKSRGPKGETGVGIESIEQFDGQSFTLRLTDGSFKKVALQPGADGAVGPQGQPGPKGDVGPAGRAGKDGAPGRDGRDGDPGPAGVSLETSVVNSNGHLLLGLTDGSVVDVGRVVGPAGATGERGPTGLPGAPGRDGTAVLSGPRAPSQDDGKEGDFWIDISTAEFSFFKKDGDGWTKLANLRQPAVDPRVGPVAAGGGAGGGGSSDGRPPLITDNLNPPANYPGQGPLKAGDFWLDGNGALHIYKSGKWNKIRVYSDAVLAAVDAPPGSAKEGGTGTVIADAPNGEKFATQNEYNQWLYDRVNREPILSTGTPAGHPAFPVTGLKDGDFWINADGVMFYWDGSAWKPIKGSDRAPIYSDTPPTEHPDYSAPENALKPGDIWFDTSNELEQHVWDGSQWVSNDDRYVNRKGDTMTGQLNVNVNSGVALSINTNKVKFWSSGAVELTSAYTAFKENELVTKKYTDDAIENASDIYAGDLPPTNPNEGLLWYQTYTDTLFIYVDGQWKPVVDPTYELDYTALGQWQYKRSTDADTGGIFRNLAASGAQPHDSLTQVRVNNTPKNDSGPVIDPNSWEPGQFLSIAKGSDKVIYKITGATASANYGDLTLEFIELDGSPFTFYVDDRINLELRKKLTGDYLPLTGGTLTGNLNVEGKVDAQDFIRGSELRSIKLTSGQNSNLEIHRGSGADEERKMLIGSDSVNFDVSINLVNSSKKDIIVQNGTKLYTGTDEIITFGGSGAFYRGNIDVDDHIVNRGYVNEAIETAVENIDIPDVDLSGYLPLGGGKMTGKLEIENIGNDALVIKNKDGGSLLKVYTGNYSEDALYGKLADDYGNSKLEIVNGFKLEAELGSYMPLSGDSTKTGKINLVANSGAQLTINKGSSLNNAVTTAQVLSDGTFETVKTTFSDNHLVTKKYADDAINTAVNNIDIPGGFNPGDRVAKNGNAGIAVGGFYLNNGNLYVKVS